MRGRILAVAALAGLAALTACDGAAPSEGAGGAGKAAAPAAFAHSATTDLSGYYIPTAPTQVGRWTLDHVFVGQAADFQAWTAGRREGVFAPVMLEFEDSESPLVKTELGEVRSGRVRVLPTTYSISDDRIRFEGRSTELGQVTLNGTLSQDALATARRNLGDEGVVMTADLAIDGRRIGQVRLRWWMGD